MLKQEQVKSDLHYFPMTVEASTFGHSHQTNSPGTPKLLKFQMLSPLLKCITNPLNRRTISYAEEPSSLHTMLQVEDSRTALITSNDHLLPGSFPSYTRLGQRGTQTLGKWVFPSVPLHMLHILYSSGIHMNPCKYSVVARDVSCNPRRQILFPSYKNSLL